MRSRFGSLAASRAALFSASCGLTSLSMTSATPAASNAFRFSAPVQQVRLCSTEAGEEDTASSERDGRRRGDDTTNKIFFNNPEIVLRKPNDDITKGSMIRLTQEGDFLLLSVNQQNKPSSEPKHFTGDRTTMRISKVLATRLLAVAEGTMPSCELVTRSKTESVVGSAISNPDGTVTISGKVTSIPQPGESEIHREFSVEFDLPEGLLMKMFLKEYIHFTTGFHASGHLDSTRVDDDDDDDDYVSRRRDRRDDRDRRDVRRNDRDRRDSRRDDRDRRDDRRVDNRRDDRDRRDNRDARRNDRDRRDFRRDDRDRRDDRGDRRRDDRKNDNRDAKKTEAKAEATPTRQYASSIY